MPDNKSKLFLTFKYHNDKDGFKLAIHVCKYLIKNLKAIGE